MSDGEAMAALPESVCRRIQQVESVIADSGVQVRKPASRHGSSYEIDVWVDPSDVEKLSQDLARIGFEAFRSVRQDDHRFWLWPGAGHWVKVDAKLTDGGRPALTGDIWWLARRRRGLVVALLGADGAGKSTAAACVQASMPIDVKLRYLGVRKRKRPGAGGRAGAGTGRTGRTTVHPLRQVAGLAKWLVAVTSSVLSIEMTARRGSVVVCDRHPIEAGLLGGEPPIVKAVKRFIARRALPKPDVVLLLSAPGEVLHARKQEHTPEILDQMTEVWRVVCRDVGGDEVDATATADVVCWEIQRVIWRHLNESRSS